MGVPSRDRRRRRRRSFTARLERAECIGHLTRDAAYPGSFLSFSPCSRIFSRGGRYGERIDRDLSLSLSPECTRRRHCAVTSTRTRLRNDRTRSTAFFLPSLDFSRDPRSSERAHHRIVSRSFVRRSFAWSSLPPLLPVTVHRPSSSAIERTAGRSSDLPSSDRRPTVAETTVVHPANRVITVTITARAKKKR